MRDKEIYQQISGIRSPWQVAEVDLCLKEEALSVHVALEPGSALHSPE